MCGKLLLSPSNMFGNDQARTTQGLLTTMASATTSRVPRLCPKGFRYVLSYTLHLFILTYLPLYISDLTVSSKLLAPPPWSCDFRYTLVVFITVLCGQSHCHSYFGDKPTETQMGTTWNSWNSCLNSSNYKTHYHN